MGTNKRTYMVQKEIKVSEANQIEGSELSAPVTAADFSASEVSDIVSVASGRTLKYARLGIDDAGNEKITAVPVNGSISGTIEGIVEGKFGPELLLVSNDSLTTIRLSNGLRVALARAEAAQGSSVTITFKGKQVMKAGRMAGKSANTFSAKLN